METQCRGVLSGVLQYLQSWFLLDLVSTLPWDLMFEAINQSSEADVGTDSSEITARVIGKNGKGNRKNRYG